MRGWGYQMIIDPFLIIFIVLLYLIFGVFLGIAFIQDSCYTGIHSDEIINAFVVFWPIILAGTTIIFLLKMIVNAFKGLYYLIIEYFKEE